MNTQTQYNQTYAYRLPPDLLAQSRALADLHEDAIFGHKDPKNIANRTFLYRFPNLLNIQLMQLHQFPDVLWFPT